MLLAKDDSDERIYALPGLKAKCPICSEEVIAKCGTIKVWHWSHKSKSDCDSFGEPETEWHLNWKKVFPKKWQEVVIKKNGQVHRADVVTSLGRIIEFQNSPLSEEKILERESFYNNMVWVLNKETIGKGLIFEDHFDDDSNFCFRWLCPPKSWFKAKKPVYISGIDCIIKIIKIQKHSWTNGLENEYTGNLIYHSGWFVECKVLTKEDFLKEVVLVEVPKDE